MLRSANGRASEATHSGRATALKTAVILVMFGPSLAAQQAGIDGVVVDQVSGAPLERVHVSLYGGDPQRRPDLIYGAMSDKIGHFSISGMTSGRYVFVLKRSGYMQSPPAEGSGTTSLLLKAGQAITDLKLEMAPSAMVSGRVVDRYGDPVQYTEIQLVPLQRAPEAFEGGGTTDERGEFRIVTGPGKFYVLARPNHFGGGMIEIRTDGSSEASYSPTYYPDSATKDRATAIEVTAGHDVDGLEVHLASAAAERRFRVSGLVTNRPGETMAFVEVRPVDNKSFEPSAPGRVEQNGEFTIQGLLPGTYDLVVRTPFGPSVPTLMRQFSWS
jgi:hypothetical protein